MNISFNRLDLRTQLLKGASPLAGETPATAIAGLACSAAIGVFGFHALRVVLGAIDN